jgi:hypothetical protein
MSPIKILEISSTLTEEGKELSKKILKELKGAFDLINLNGSLIKIRNGKNEDDNIKLCYVGGVSNGDTLIRRVNDTRTYKQMDALEVYVLYHLLQNPFLFIANSGSLDGKNCAFNVETWLDEIGINKRHYLTQAKL